MWFTYSYLSGLLHWHWDNHIIAPVPVKQSLSIWLKLAYNQAQQCTNNMYDYKHIYLFAFMH